MVDFNKLGATFFVPVLPRHANMADLCINAQRPAASAACVRRLASVLGGHGVHGRPLHQCTTPHRNPTVLLPGAKLVRPHTTLHHRRPLQCHRLINGTR
jgi:hypothetical protein